jgi:ankyrin repeat protein
MMVSAFGNLVMVTKLVDRGVSLDAQDHGQRTALYYACDTGNSDVAMFLLQRGANAALSNLTLTTPLMLGCLDKDEAIVSAVLGTPTLDHGHVNLVDHHSMTALFHAVSSGHGPSPIVALLLEHGSLLDCRPRTWCMHGGGGGWCVCVQVLCIHIR